MFKLRPSYLLAAGILAPTLTLAMPQDKVTLFTAKLDTKSVVHKLYQPGDSNAPQPFYKSFCKNEKSGSYNNAHGNATLAYDDKTKTLWFAFSYAGLSGSPIMMHFHVAAAGKSGPIVQTICGAPPPNNPKLGSSNKPVVSAKCLTGTSGFIVGKYKLQGNKSLKPALSAQMETNDLMSGNLYINIHTCLNELGELRGQILPSK